MFILPKLPYDYAALEPTLSADTLHTHHDKHHKTYVEKTNELARTAGLDGRALEDVVREAQRKGDAKLFHNAAQAWNHAFFWQCMTPERRARALRRAQGRDRTGFRRPRRLQGRLRRPRASTTSARAGSGWPPGRTG